MKKNSILVGTILMAIVMFVFGMFSYQSRKGYERSDAAERNRTALVQSHSPTLGAADAKVTIVEFFDPACETCREFYPIVKSILKENDGKVKLVLRYAPFHKDSDKVVKILEAAKTQGLYWQTLEAALKSQPDWAAHGNPQVDLIWPSLEAAGLNITKAKLDMNASEFITVLKKDMEDVFALKVEKTPTFFVNGKPLLTFGEDELRTLVKREIDAAYK
jgi:protein-disulfide isomerase